MDIEIKLERLSPGSKEGKVGKIHAQIGHKLGAGDLIMEVEGKKGNTPIKSPTEGVITNIEVEEGDMVVIGQVLSKITKTEKGIASNFEPDDPLTSKNNSPNNMEIMEADIAILGGGPGGYVAAIQGAKLGAKVILIEKDKVGGTCLNRGCIPTKALVRSAQVYEDIKNAEQYGITLENHAIDMEKVIKRKDSIVENLVQGIEHLLNKQKITLKTGNGKLIDPNTIQIDEKTLVRAKNIIIATGSKVCTPPFPGMDLKNVLCSDEALNLKELPDKIVIVGGGIIGMEFAFIYANMGVDVSVIEYMDHVLCMLDQDVIREITRAAKIKGIKLYTSSKVEEIIKGEDNNCIIKFKQKERDKYLSSDKVLVCVGRNPAYENIGLEEMNIHINPENKGIQVNQRMQTNIPHIYAIGDVTNIMQLAHVASHQGIVAVKNILGQDVEMDYSAVPSAIFTSPEIATVGISEKDAKEKNIEIIMGKFPFAANGKAMTYGETRGFVKIIKEKETDKIIGCTIIGPHASDLIAEITLAIKNGLKAEDIVNTIHAHPTTAEAIHEGALSVEGGALHFAN
ncbi:MAG: dihydrolipoyl dehydrogenase [Epulopiscium sp.]|nr:dihydrolipoyl dehydrogenase [Candidatus Epulonipiscium sp.]